MASASSSAATSMALLKAKGLSRPPLALQQSDGFQNPWHCLACDNWNSSRYMHCIKCASQRATVDGSHTEREDNEDNTNSSRGKSANNDAQDVAEDAESVSSPKGADSPVNDDSSNGTESPSSTETTTRICEFFLRGKCKRRRNCPFLHCMPEDELKIRKARIVERAKALEMREQELAILEADLKRREEVVQQDSSRIAVQSNLLDSRRSELEAARRDVESMRSELFDERKQHSSLKMKYKAKEAEAKEADVFDVADDIVWQFQRKGNWIQFDSESTRRLEQAFRKLGASATASPQSSGVAASAGGGSSGSTRPANVKPKKVHAKPGASTGASRQATGHGRTKGAKGAQRTAARSGSAGVRLPKASKTQKHVKTNDMLRIPGEEITVVIGDRPHQCNVRTFMRYDPVAKSQSRIRRSNSQAAFEKVSGSLRIKSIGGIFERMKLRDFSEVEKFVNAAHIGQNSAYKQVLKSCMLIQPRKMSYEFKASKSGNNKLLFHATSADSALKIQSGHFIPSSSGMLGQGIYFAPSPEKSAGYYRGASRTMLLCYVNLDNAKTRGANAMLEYCVDSYEKCIPLYMLVF